MSRRALLAITSIAALTSPALATAEDVQPVRVDYRAPPGCPDEAWFLAQLRARTQLFGYAPGDAPVQTFRVRVSSTARGVKGTLTIVDPSGRTSVREVAAASCDDVVDAVALMAALAVDSNAVTSPIRPTQSPTRIPEPAPTREPSGSISSTASSRWRLSAGVDIGFRTGLAPDALWEAPLFVELARDVPASLGGPSFRASFEHTATGAEVISPGAARFTWTAGRLDACPVRLGADKVGLSPCARLELGALSGTGTGIANGREETRFWSATGALGRVDWRLGEGLYVEAEGGAMISLTREHYFFPPNTPIYDVPDLGASGSLGFGAYFW